MKPIDCAARNEGRVCLSCEAWEAGFRSGESAGVGRFFPDHADFVAYCERGPEPLRFNGHGAFDLDGEDDGEP